MSDARLVTKTTAVLDPNPPQPGNPTEFFGEETNDLQLNSVNDLALISGIDKLKQDLNKILFTEVGANVNFEIYGTELQTMVGGKVNADNVRAKVREQVDTALSTLLFITKDNDAHCDPGIFDGFIQTLLQIRSIREQLKDGGAET